MSTIARNLQAVHDRIAMAAHAVLRDPREIKLLAVSKTFGAEVVQQAVHAGHTAFGENYLQEALDKMAAVRLALPDAQLEWHFIGPIQSNKTRLIAEHFDWVHSVDREKIARRLSEQRPAHLAPLNICLQINISAEASKSGITVADAVSLAQAVAVLPHLRLRGLMAIPQPSADPVQQRAGFRQLRLLQEACHAQGLAMDTLSMGMSADLEAAVAEGATVVRVGSAIFGQR